MNVTHNHECNELVLHIRALNGNTVCSLVFEFVRIEEASISSTLCMRDRQQRRNIMVLSGLCVRHLFIVGLELMLQRCEDMGLTRRAIHFLVR